jgi:hypothetical protein
MKFSSWTALALAVCCAAACTNDAPVVIKTLAGKGGTKVSVAIHPGAEWIQTAPYNAAPQFAVWIEDGNGRYLDTLFVTAKSARQGWAFADEKRKPGALPVWSHRRGVRAPDGLFMPARENPLPDAVTAATPRGRSTIECVLPASAGKVRVCVELNHSVDWNDVYRERLLPDDPRFSKDVGQPSVVYAADIDPGKPGASEARLVGHGDVTGKTGEVTGDVSGLTSALALVESIVIVVE